ncbi:Cobalamin synthase [Stieleria bergensis]|uniref:Adenosylcobinamide-GDP ribazoletransferase n=1 Tax=Stieleria bergensis TaxID=2528025 RepID=A0A517T168_9BACT|nr:Cobalamin synthase [Planctomycetes bacterium SV_7m_r]
MSRSDQDTDLKRPPSLWESFATAVHFLTRITVSKIAMDDSLDHARALNRSVVFFPLVGGVIGLATAALVCGLAWLGFPALLAALMAIGIEAYLTGAFHEDAFADTCDALGGGWTREDVLKIMKDSRLGTYGTMGLLIGVSIRWMAIGTMVQEDWQWTLAAVVAAAALGRFAIVTLMSTTAPIGDRDSQAKDVSGNQSGGRLLVAGLLMTPFCAPWFVLRPWHAVGAIVAAGIVLLWYRHKILKRLGGTTGDLLGASGFLIQLVILIGACLR